MEILSVFPGLDGLVEFREWVFSGSNDPKPKDIPVKALEGLTDAEQKALVAAYNKALFKYKHRHVRYTWNLSRNFPDVSIVNAYKNPPVDLSKEKFVW